MQTVTSGQRLHDRAEDYPDAPDAGDRIIARMLYEAGASDLNPEHHGPQRHYQVVNRISHPVAGGADFFGPPEGGVAESGYGIVPSRQGIGHARSYGRQVASFAHRLGVPANSC